MGRPAALAMGILLAGLWSGLSGCAGARVNAWPLFFSQERSPGEEGARASRVTEILYPFFGVETGPGRRSHVLRPLYNYERDEGRGLSQVQYLWPLGLWQSKDGRTWLLRLWPLFQEASTRRRSTGQSTTHGMLFPLLYWGRRGGEGGYFALFPLGGVTHGLLGDTFSFVLFPLYSYYRMGHYVRHDVLWPILSWGSTADGRRKRVRIWPFYVRDWRQDTWAHHYLLWPLVRWGWQRWSTSQESYERRYWAFHPFVARSRLRNSRGEVVAWASQGALLSRARDMRPGKELDRWSALVGLICSGTSPRTDELRLFPLYWRKAHYQGGKGSGRVWTRQRILWPIIWLDHSTLEADNVKSSLIVAPIYWHFTRRYTAGEHEGRTSRSITLWPLFTWKRDADGAAHFWIASHGWSDASGGYKRNYRAFFDLFQYHSQPDGQKEMRLLWRLYHYRRTPAGRYLSVGPLFTYDSLGDEGAGNERSFSVLLGLVKYAWSPKGGRWRLFYVPLGG